jgi:hypothetical protein
MPTPGRPRRLDAEECEEICNLVAAGHSMVAVARAVACNVKTIRRHAAHDDRFRRQLAAAEIAARNDPAKLLRRAASSHWRAAAWLLERTDPEKYSRTAQPVCRPEGVKAAFDQFIEVALRTAPDRHASRDFYQRLAKVAEEQLTRLFQPASSPGKSPFAEATPLLDEQRLFDYLDEVCSEPKPKAPEPPPQSASPAEEKQQQAA